MEQVLEMALLNVGGSIETLEKALDEIASQKARGPRDEMVKDILERLMSCERYVQLNHSNQ